jgi:hypothetical protein
MADNYEVLVPELTVHRQVGELTDPITGRSLGVQQGQGKTWFAGEVLSTSDVSPLLLDALNDEDHPSHASVARKLRKVGDEPSLNTAQRLGLPFDGYGDMDEDDILAAMRVLPSPTVQRIKEYEATQGKRDRILAYNIGFGEHPDDRLEGRVSSDHQEPAEGKPSSGLKTRNVEEESVERGEGYTGTGDPQVPYGESEESDDDDKPKTAQRRRSRRTRPAAKSEGESNQGGGE